MTRVMTTPGVTTQKMRMAIIIIIRILCRSRPGKTTVWRNQKNVDGVARLTINARSL